MAQLFLSTIACLTSTITTIGEWSVSDKIAFVNCTFTCLFLLATIISVICAFKAYKHQKDRARKEAACSLARYYAENIIIRHSFVLLVMQCAEVDSKAKKLFPYDELSLFSRAELLTFLERKGMTYEQAEDVFTNLDPQAILNAKFSFSISVEEKRNMIQEYFITDQETGEKHIAFAQTLQNEFLDKVWDFLNDLEWFSMSCRYGISDEEILYQSLHSTFLSTIWMLYFYIADRNHTNEDKLFTNIIWLFDEWRKRLIDIQKAAEKKQAKAERKIKTAERKKVAAEQKLNQIEPKIHSGKPLK